jgi:hypothetical protein
VVDATGYLGSLVVLPSLWKSQRARDHRCGNSDEVQKALANKSVAFDGGFCAGFIDAVIDSMNMWEADDISEKRPHAIRFCLPQEGTNGQYLQVFLKYLDQHPEELHKAAAFLLVESLRAAFPCSR